MADVEASWKTSTAVYAGLALVVAVGRMEFRPAFLTAMRLVYIPGRRDDACA